MAINESMHYKTVLLGSPFKMLGLYLYTNKIGHTSCNMLIILNIVTLQ